MLAKEKSPFYGMELKPQIRVKIPFLITQKKNIRGVRLRELFPVEFVDIPW